MGIPLDPPDSLMKYIGSLKYYIIHYLLLFQPTSIDVAIVKDIHLERRWKYEQGNNENKEMTTNKEDTKTSFTNCEK